MTSQKKLKGFHSSRKRSELEGTDEVLQFDDLSLEVFSDRDGVDKMHYHPSTLEIFQKY